MRVLIVGSKGFIGSHLVSHLESVFDVWGCDVFTNYNEKKYTIITSPVDFTSLFHNQQYDVCINASGASSVADSLKNPARDFELNVHNVALILESIRVHQPSCRFINLSSAAVYGNPSTLPISETHKLAPLSPYGFHKMQAENLCTEYSRFFNVDAISVRIFSAYGPGLKKQILWDLYKKSLNTSVIELFGTGDETRDYIFIDDIVRALKIIAIAPKPESVYNLASGHAQALHELCKIFLSEMHWSGELKFNKVRREGDPDFWRADVSRINALGFSPRVTLHEGIKQYVEWLSRLE